MSQACQYVTFWVGDLYCGIAASQVQEVLWVRSLTRVPLAPASIAGLINLRGQVLPVIEMRRRLKQPPSSECRQSACVVVQVGGEAAGLLADRLGDVVEAAGQNVRVVPENLVSSVGEVLSGVLKLEQGLLLVLAPERVVEIKEA